VNDLRTLSQASSDYAGASNIGDAYGGKCKTKAKSS
jgi:hypothetical protein